MSFLQALANYRRRKRLERRRDEATYAVQTIRAFLEGTGGAHEWDDFTSCSLRDPELNRIRKLARAVELPAGREERATLETLAQQAERLASR
jgi:hypothetical protein